MAKLDYSKIFIREACPTKIGGQAVMEGVMMKGPDRIALAMRIPSGELYLKTKKLPKESPVMSWPFVRGIVAFASSLVSGMSTLMESADILEKYAPEQYAEEPGRLEAWVNRKFGDKAAWNFMMTTALLLAVLISVVFFIILPTWVVNIFSKVTSSSIILNLIEGLLRIAMFVGYVAAIRKMEDIKTLFRYHGAEHKTIHCFENGLELTPENAQQFYTLHPRCGTSFMVFVLIISLLLFSFLGWPSLLWRIVSRILLIPVIAGISYELLKWAGRSDGKLVRALSYPGLMLQKLTTAEPTNAQLEVAILSLKAVLVDKEAPEIDGFVDKDGKLLPDDIDEYEDFAFAEPDDFGTEDNQSVTDFLKEFDDLFDDSPDNSDSTDNTDLTRADETDSVQSGKTDFNASEPVAEADGIEYTIVQPLYTEEELKAAASAGTSGAAGTSQAASSASDSKAADSADTSADDGESDDFARDGEDSGFLSAAERAAMSFASDPAESLKSAYGRAENAVKAAADRFINYSDDPLAGGDDKASWMPDRVSALLAQLRERVRGFDWDILPKKKDDSKNWDELWYGDSDVMAVKLPEEDASEVPDEESIREAIRFLSELDKDGYTIVTPQDVDAVNIARGIADHFKEDAKARTLARRYTNDITTIDNALRWGQAALSMVENGRNDAVTILSYATGLTRTELITSGRELMDEEDFAVFESKIQERLTGTPLQYITGIQEFMGMPFRVNENVLIPRLDTEVLVDEVIKIIRTKDWLHPEVLDMCTGSGAIGVSIAGKVPEALITMTDVSEEALRTAAGNAGINGVNRQCIFLRGDMFDALPEEKLFDVIVCNPPYIPSAEIDNLSVEVRDHEPRTALDGGADGLDYYRIIADRASGHLRSGGVLALEIGHDQAGSVKRLLGKARTYSGIHKIRDLAGLDRVIIAERI